MSEHMAAKTPLVDLLRYTPIDAVHNIPYGRLCHEAAERIKALEAVAEAQAEYIKLLEAEAKEVFPIVFNHGYRSSRNVEGRIARAIIADAKQAAGYNGEGK
jgi:hypothetical protein